MKKRLISLLLVAVMLLSLVACAGPGNTDSTTLPPVDPDDVLTELTLPLTTEKKELSVWLIWTNTATPDPNDLEGVQYIEELTGVHINWIPVSAGEAAEKFQLLQASTDIPDILIVPPSYTSPVDDAIAEGWAIDMSNLIATVMPNYRAYLESHPVEAKNLQSEDGVIRSFANVAGNDDGYLGEQQWAGLCVRTDLIEKAGYTGKLETVQDYYNMLTMCKQNLEGLDAPLYLIPSGSTITGAFMTAYGVNNGIMVEDGQVKYGPVQEGYGQWLAEMRKWYAEGLIDPNFDTVGGLDPYMAPASTVGTNKSVVFSTIYNCIGSLMPMLLGVTTDPTSVITPVLNPVLNAGDQPMINNVGTGTDGTSVTGKVFISADCEDPELAAMWLDFMITEQAMVAGHYGKEGVHYDKATDPDAPFQYILKEGYATTDERTAKLGTPGVGYYNWDTNAQADSASMDALLMMYAAQGITFPDTYQDQRDAKAMWSTQPSIQNDVILGLALDADQTAAIQTIKADIDTRIAEYTVQYIKGQTNESFEDFCKSLWDMQLQLVLDTYQEVYDEKHG